MPAGLWFRGGLAVLPHHPFPPCSCLDALNRSCCCCFRSNEKVPSRPPFLSDFLPPVRTVMSSQTGKDRERKRTLSCLYLEGVLGPGCVLSPVIWCVQRDPRPFQCCSEPPASASGAPGSPLLSPDQSVAPRVSPACWQEDIGLVSRGGASLQGTSYPLPYPP